MCNGKNTISNNNPFSPILNCFYKVCRFLLPAGTGSIIWPFMGKEKGLIILFSCCTTIFLRCVKMVATTYCPSSFFLIRYWKPLISTLPWASTFLTKEPFLFAMGRSRYPWAFMGGSRVNPTGRLFQRLPHKVSVHSRKPCTMVFMRKSPVRFLYW